MNKPAIGILFLVAFAFQSTVFADQAQELKWIKQSKEDCASLKTQVELNGCAGGEFYKTDLEMNRTYNAQTARISVTDQLKLRKAQKAWLAFRDASCEYENGGNEGGSIYPMIDFQCKAKLTKQRVETLKRYLACGSDQSPSLCEEP